MALHPGYVIQTDPTGRAEALLEDGTEVKINIRTILELLASRSRPVRVIRGQVFMRARSELRINTPTADCHVYGTELNIEVADDGATTLTVAEGSVEFGNAQGRVVVRAREQSTARMGQKPSTPVAVANLPQLIQWSDDVQPVALELETAYVSQDPAVLKAALRQVEAVPAGSEREQRLGDLQHDLGAFDAGEYPAALSEARQSYEQALQALPPTATPAQRALLIGRIGQVWLEMGNIPNARSRFEESLKEDPRNSAARIGLVMALLSQPGQRERALAEARTAVGDAPRSAAAHTALALALIGQSRAEDALARRQAALRELEQALALDPGYAPAAAWKSFLLRTASRLDEALAAARDAVARGPFSSLAHQALSDAWFAVDRIQEARSEARRAVALNPLSPGARASLARVLLQSGNVDGGVRESSQAVALGPNLDRAHFLLGLALWEQQRLDAAAAEFERALALDPGYLEARAYLAQVYVAQGRKDRAEAVAREAQALNPNFPPVRAALGLVYYNAGLLKEAVQEYRAALDLQQGKPGPGYELGLARAYLEENDLPDALAHGLKAVSEAPRSHQAHTLLGLIYDRRNDSEQALREYREGLSLYPDDALARLGLATSTPSPDQRVRAIRRVVTSNPQVSFVTADTGDSLREIAQAMLRDPAVLSEIFKPGKTAEVAPAVGSEETVALDLTHRDLYALGKLHDLSFGNREQDESYRNDRGEKRTFGWVNLTAAPSYRSHVLAQYLYSGADQAQPGATTDPTPNGRTSFWENSWDLSSRFQLDPATFFWFHAGYQLSTTVDQDPDTVQDRFYLLEEPTLLSHSRYSQLGAEARLDRRWGGGHTTSYALFAGRNALNNPKLRFRRSTRQFDDIQQFFDTDRVVAHTFQHEYDPGGRFSLILGATAERYTSHFSAENPGESVSASLPIIETRWLPFTQATYILTQRDLVRAIAHRRTARGFSPILQPAEAFLVDESPALEPGGQATNYELDLEHRFSSRLFTKLFLFSGNLKDLILLPAVTQTPNEFVFTGPNGPQAYPLGMVIPAAHLQGAGIRVEHQIGRFLSGYLRYTYREFVDKTRVGGRGYDPIQNPNYDRQLPQNPRSSTLLGLSYIDRAGTKLLAEADWSADALQGVDRTRVPWQRLPGAVLVNLQLGREPSLSHEWVFGISNLLNTGTSYWPGFPAPGREYRVQYYFRF